MNQRNWFIIIVFFILEIVPKSFKSQYAIKVYSDV